MHRKIPQFNSWIAHLRIP